MSVHSRSKLAEGLDNSDGNTQKDKQHLTSRSPPPSPPALRNLPIRTKPLASPDGPTFPPRISTLMRPEEIIKLRDSYPVAFQGLMYTQFSQFAGVLETITDTVEQTRRAFDKEIKGLKSDIGSRNEHIRLLANKMNETPQPSTEEMVAQALHNTSVQMLEEQMDRLQFDRGELLKERNALCDDIDNIKRHYAQNLLEKDEEIYMLRREVSRLLNKNMKETIEYNDLVDDHKVLQTQLERAKERMILLKDTKPEEHEAEDVQSGKRSLRSKSAKEADLAEKQQLTDDLKKAKKEILEVVDQHNEVVAEKETKFRSLRNQHLKLKRKYEHLTANPLPSTRPPVSDESTSQGPATKKRKTRNSASSPTSTIRAEPSKLNIDLKVFTLAEDGEISRSVYMHAIEPSIFPSGEYWGLKSVAWSLLRASYSGTGLTAEASIEESQIIVRVKGFPNGRWETVNEGGLKIWWMAAKGLAEQFDGGLLGEVDVLFALGGVEGREWIVERSMRLADALGTGDGFAVIGNAT